MKVKKKLTAPEKMDMLYKLYLSGTKGTRKKINELKNAGAKDSEIVPVLYLIKGDITRMLKDLGEEKP